MSRIAEYIQYHVDSSRALDIDPQIEALQYICNRFELNMEQRYWLAFLFSTNYCVPTTYYMYNEFPDYATVDEGRLQRWWEQNRDKLIFQTDKAWIRSRNQFVQVFKSYRGFVWRYSGCEDNQERAIRAAIGVAVDSYQAYDNLRKNFNVFQFGRFAMFLYSELLNQLCGCDIAVRFNLAEAESSRNGLVFALGVEDKLYTGRSGKSLDAQSIQYLDRSLKLIADHIGKLNIKPRHKTLWSIETTLCAYKKHCLNNKRWVGYYIERMRKEIMKLEATTCKWAEGGVNWHPLWEFRVETYQPQYLKELQ